MKIWKCVFCFFSLTVVAGLAFGQQNTPDSATRSNELAQADQLEAQIAALFKQQQFDKALTLAQQELALREKALGPNHPTVGDVSRNVAEILFVKGKYKDAIVDYRRFLQIYENAFGADSPKLIDALYRYVSILSAANQRADALDVQKRVFRLENGFDFDQLTVQKNKNLVQSGLMAGTMTVGTTPPYSQEAKNGGISGPVVLKMTLDERGQLSSINVLSGHPLLSAPAELAARRSTYAPAKLDGMPVKITGLLIYNFGMDLNNTRSDSISARPLQR
jgi:tetratricopeptide (TPR) repeat protein